MFILFDPALKKWIKLTLNMFVSDQIGRLVHSFICKNQKPVLLYNQFWMFVILGTMASMEYFGSWFYLLAGTVTRLYHFEYSNFIFLHVKHSSLTGLETRAIVLNLIQNSSRVSTMPTLWVKVNIFVSLHNITCLANYQIIIRHSKCTSP